MPLYEFRCLLCGTEFEVKRPMTEAGAPAGCPRCGGAGERLLSTFAASNTFVGIASVKQVFRAPFVPPKKETGKG